MSQTYVILNVSPECYQEIRDRLTTAGYQHAFKGEGWGELIVMDGIALWPRASDHEHDSPLALPEPDLSQPQGGAAIEGGVDASIRVDQRNALSEENAALRGQVAALRWAVDGGDPDVPRWVAGGTLGAAMDVMDLYATNSGPPEDPEAVFDLRRDLKEMRNAICAALASGAGEREAEVIRAAIEDAKTEGASLRLISAVSKLLALRGEGGSDGV